MKRLLVLGAGTAGTMAVNKLRPHLPLDEWEITVVDSAPEHYYQPGYLFIPFGTYQPDEVVKQKADLITDGVDLVMGEVDVVKPDESVVVLSDGRELPYDQLIIATGTHPRRDQTEGLDGDDYGVTVHDFYTFEGASRLAEVLDGWEGGRLVLNIVEMPIKCPVAPLEFMFLADAFFTERGHSRQGRADLRDPARRCLHQARRREAPGRHARPPQHNDRDRLHDDGGRRRTQQLVSYDEREIPYDLLVTVPVNMGADFVERSGLGDELNHVEVDKFTFLSDEHDNIFALGDASNIPTSKAGSVAHFAVDIFVGNFLQHIAGKPMTGQFDGHANCFIESGNGKGLLIDFNYDVEPLPGKYPLPGIGPFSLLKETEANHWGKLMFKWTYWNVLLPGRELPIAARMTMAGKQRDLEEVGS